MRGISIPIGQDRVPARVPQDVTAHDPDLSPLDLVLDPTLDVVVVDEIVQVGMGVEDVEAQVIAATAVMMIGAEADLADEVEEPDGRMGLHDLALEEDQSV